AGPDGADPVVDLHAISFVAEGLRLVGPGGLHRQPARAAEAGIDQLGVGGNDADPVALPGGQLQGAALAVDADGAAQFAGAAQLDAALDGLALVVQAGPQQAVGLDGAEGVVPVFEDLVVLREAVEDGVEDVGADVDEDAAAALVLAQVAQGGQVPGVL